MFPLGAIHICTTEELPASTMQTTVRRARSSMAWWPCFLRERHDGDRTCFTGSEFRSSRCVTWNLFIHRLHHSFLCVLYVCVADAVLASTSRRPEHLKNHIWYRLGQFLVPASGKNCVFKLALTAVCLWGMFYFRRDESHSLFPDGLR